MWSDLLQILFNHEKKSSTDPNPQDPNVLLALAEKELIKAIADAEQVKRVAQNNYHSLLAKAEELQGQANQMYQAAQKSLQTGNEEQAQQWLRKKSLVDERISEYKTLLDQAQQLLHQLEAQHQDLQFRLESTRLKGQMLIAKVEAAKTQKLVDGVQNSENSSAFEQISVLEQQFQIKEDERSMREELQQNDTIIKKAFEEIAFQQSIEKDWEKLKSEKDLKLNDKQAKKIEDFFSKTKENPTEKPQSDKQKKIDDFFK